jgi:hypothetical protein
VGTILLYKSNYLDSLIAACVAIRQERQSKAIFFYIAKRSSQATYDLTASAL